MDTWSKVRPTFRFLAAATHRCVLPVSNSPRGAVPASLRRVLPHRETLLGFLKAFSSSPQITFVALSSLCRAFLPQPRQSQTRRWSQRPAVSSSSLFHPFIRSLCVFRAPPGSAGAAGFIWSVSTAERGALHVGGARVWKSKVSLCFSPEDDSSGLTLNPFTPRDSSSSW